MTRVVVHIGRLVVHGAESFSAEAFGDLLGWEIGQHLGGGLKTADIAHRLQAGAAPSQRGNSRGAGPNQATGPAHFTPERIAARQVAGRLLR